MMLKGLNFLKIFAIVLAVLTVLGFALTSCAKGNSEPVGDGEAPEETVSILKTELINGDLIVTYSDGRVVNLGPLSGESDSDSLSFYPLPDGTYGITAGNTIYLEGIAIPATYKGRAVTRILNDAFEGLENLRSVSIPEGIVSIGASAFSGCVSLESVTIPTTVTAIDASAFYGCKALTEITVPEGVGSVGSQAFYMCERINSINLPNTDISIGGSAFFGTAYYNNEENWTDGSLYIGKHLISVKNTVSEMFKINDGTLTVAKYAFRLCEAVKSVTVPDSVLRIGDLAFAECSGLTEVAIGDGSALESLGEGAFMNCGSLLGFDVPRGLAVIPEGAFSGCVSLKCLTVDDAVNLKAIEKNAFFGCSSLLEIGIADSLETVGESAFEGCASLVTVNIDLDKCKLTSIGDRAFFGCKKLEEIGLPMSISSIGADAFCECAALSKVAYDGTEVEWKKVTKGANWSGEGGNVQVIFKEITENPDEN